MGCVQQPQSIYAADYLNYFIIYSYDWKRQMHVSAVLKALTQAQPDPESGKVCTWIGGGTECCLPLGTSASLSPD